MSAARAQVPAIAGRPIPRPVVNTARQAFRSFGSATARWRPLPDFLIAGGKRCGTTSLYFHLLQHPQLLPMFPSARYLPKARDGKGPHFFDNQHARGPRWYAGHFPTARQRHSIQRRSGLPTVVGEGSPYSLFHPLAAQRAAALIPDLKVILILRDPVDRTHSHYREQVRNGVENLSFEEALAAEPGRTAGEEQRLIDQPGYVSFAHEHQSYVGQSEYLRGVRRWLDAYPRDRVKIIASESYYRSPARVVDELWSFLSVAPIEQAGAPVLNAAPMSTLDDEVARRLRAHFAPINAALFELIGHSLPWPSTQPRGHDGRGG